MAPNESLQTQVYHSLEELESLRSEWEALLSTSPSATMFSTPEWLIPWWRAFGGHDRLRVLAVRDKFSLLVGFAPLALTNYRGFGMELRLLRLVGDGSHDSDNLDLPVRPGGEAGFGGALLDWLEQQAADWDICRLNTLPSHSPVANRLIDDLNKRGWTYFSSSLPRCVVDLPESWESYLKGLSGKERGKIGLRTRRLHKRYKVRIRKCVEEDQLDPALGALFELHGKHWRLRGLPGTLHVPARQRFYHELARLLLRRKQLEFWLLELDDKIVAAQFGFRHGDVVFSQQEGFDPDYSSDSIGYVLRSQVLKHLIANGVRHYDFLGGTDDSKVRWGAQVKSYLNIEFARPLTRGSVDLVLKYKSAATKRWLREYLPAQAWQVLKTVGARLRKRRTLE